jgi:hypothetical protein
MSLMSCDNPTEAHDLQQTTKAFHCHKVLSNHRQKFKHVVHKAVINSGWCMAASINNATAQWLS